MKYQTTAYKGLMAKRIRPPSLLKVQVNTGGTTYTFRENEIISAQKVDDVDPLSRKLPKQTFTFTVADPNGDYDPANPSGKWLAFDENNEVTVAFGLVVGGYETFLASDTYYLKGTPSSSKGTATFSAVGRLSILNDLCVIDPSPLSYYDAIVSVLQDAGLTSADYDIDTTLANVIGNTLRGQPATHAEMVQRFAHATGRALYTRNGKICVYKTVNIPSDFSYFITTGEIINSTMSKDDPVGTIVKRSYAINSGTGSEETVWAASVDFGSVSTLEHIKFKTDTPCELDDVTATGSVMISSSDLYTWGGIITAAGVGTAQIEVTGWKDTLEYWDTNEVIGTGTGIVTIANPLLNFDEVNSLAGDLLNDYIYYLDKRNNYVVQHRGSDAIETGDTLTFTNPATGTNVEAVVLAVTINYNGAISTVLTLKELGTGGKDKLSAPAITINDYLLNITDTSGLAQKYEIYDGNTLVATIPK